MAKLITIEKSTFDKAIDAINRENKDLREQLKASREKSHEFYDLLQTMRGKLVACEKVLKTVAYVVTDEDEHGNPVTEKWNISHQRDY